MRRREVIKVGSLFGLGAGTPSRFPYPDRPQAGPGIGAGSGQTIRAKFVIITDVFGGVFIYTGVPGPGNAPVAWMSFAPTDPYGNPLLFPGVGVRNGSLLAGLTDHAEVIVGAVGETVFGGISDSGSGATSFGSSQTGVGDLGAFLTLRSKNGGGTPGPQAILDNASLISTAGTPANPTQLATDVWQAVTPNAGNGWGGSGRVKLLSEKNVCMCQMSLSAGTIANGTAAASVPAAYIPAVTQFLPVGTGSGTGALTNGPYMQLTVGGNWQVENLPTGTATVHLNGTYALD